MPRGYATSHDATRLRHRFSLEVHVSIRGSLVCRASAENPLLYVGWFTREFVHPHFLMWPWGKMRRSRKIAYTEWYSD